MDEKKRTPQSGGIGVGYVSLIMLFAVITLTVLAVLSYQAAGANETLNERNVTFSKEYYAADGRAKEKLMQLDEAALDSLNSFFFEDSFCEFCDGTEGVSSEIAPDGVMVKFTEPLNERQQLSVAVVFYKTPAEGKRYSIERWKTVPVSTDDEGELGVWDGSTFG